MSHLYDICDCGVLHEKAWGCEYCDTPAVWLCSEACRDNHYAEVSHPARDEEYAREARFTAWKEDHSCPF